jgi:hypothetical protein
LANLPNCRREHHQLVSSVRTSTLKNSDIFNLAQSLHLMWCGPIKGHGTKKGNAMIVLNSARDTATAFAAAFLTAMLFVSSATSALPIA